MCFITPIIERKQKNTVMNTRLFRIFFWDNLNILVLLPREIVTENVMRNSWWVFEINYIV